MAHKRGPALSTLPPVIHPEQRLTIQQVCLLRGCGRTKLYADLQSGKFKLPLERDGRTVRARAADVFAALNGRAQ